MYSDSYWTAKRWSLLAALALSLLVVLPGEARAGGLQDKIDFIRFRPFIGYEFSRVGTIEANLSNTAAPQVKTDAFYASGMAWGASAGFRIGPISLDALFQRLEFARTDDGRDVGMDKLYLDLGFNLGSGWIRSVIDIAFGYSFLDIHDDPRHQGFGGKIGASLDFYPAKWFSVGPTASFDAQGYVLDNGVIGAYGATFTARVGFHL